MTQAEQAAAWQHDMYNCQLIQRGADCTCGLDAYRAALTAVPQGVGLRAEVENLMGYLSNLGGDAWNEEDWNEIYWVDGAYDRVKKALASPALDVGLRGDYDYEFLRGLVRSHLIAHEKVTEAESTGGPTLIAAWKLQLKLSLEALVDATLAESAKVEGPQRL